MDVCLGDFPFTDQIFGSRFPKIKDKHLAFLAFRLQIPGKNQNKQNGQPNSLVLQGSLSNHSFGVSMPPICLVISC